MIGPAKSGGEGFARRLNRREWQAENRDRKLTQAEEMVFCVVLSCCCGGLMAAGLLCGIDAAEGMSR